MKDLIEQLEKATGPDRDLDLEIINVGAEHKWRWHRRTDETITNDRYGPNALGNPICTLERFTFSIDDAVSLLPDGWGFSISNRAPGPKMGRAWVHNKKLVESRAYRGAEYTAATPAIAMCMACIDARAALSHPNQTEPT